MSALSVPALRRRLGGQAFLFGAYRFHTDHSASSAIACCERAFPEHRGRWTPFAEDTAGRQFVVDPAGRVTIVDPQRQELTPTRWDLTGFHEALLDDPETLLPL